MKRILASLVAAFGLAALATGQTVVAMHEHPPTATHSARVTKADPRVPADLVPAQPTACQRAMLASMRDALPALGERYVWSDLSRADAWGLAFGPQTTIALSIHTPCEHVPFVAAHEWLHVADWRTDNAFLPGESARGVPIAELAADYGAQVLTSDLDPNLPAYAPYAAENGGHDVSAARQARALLDHFGAL